MALPSTNKRVVESTSDRWNEAIRQDIERSLAYYREHPDRIDQRLGELEREWDIERVLEANASTLALTGSVLGFVAHRRFFALPLVVSAFLLQHALQGWCPPLPVLRRMGYRTTGEIEMERNGLEAIGTRH